MGYGFRAANAEVTMGFDFSMNQLPLVGNFFDNPNEGRMTQQMHQAGLNYQAYRPELANARLNALNQQASMFRPVHAMLGQMYGPQAQMDMTQAAQNPMSQRMMGMGATSDAAGPPPPMSPADMELPGKKGKR